MPGLAQRFLQVLDAGVADRPVVSDGLLQTPAPVGIQPQADVVAEHPVHRPRELDVVRQRPESHLELDGAATGVTEVRGLLHDLLPGTHQQSADWYCAVKVCQTRTGLHLASFRQARERRFHTEPHGRRYRGRWCEPRSRFPLSRSVIELRATQALREAGDFRFGVLDAFAAECRERRHVAPARRAGVRIDSDQDAFALMDDATRQRQRFRKRQTIAKEPAIRDSHSIQPMENSAL